MPLLKNLVEQIDALSTIANEFSNFAKMPKAHLSPTDISEIITSTIELYSKETSTQITFDPNPNMPMVEGDKEQLLRVFSNLIKIIPIIFFISTLNPFKQYCCLMIHFHFLILFYLSDSLVYP